MPTGGARPDRPDYDSAVGRRATHPPELFVRSTKSERAMMCKKGRVRQAEKL